MFSINRTAHNLIIRTQEIKRIRVWYRYEVDTLCTYSTSQPATAKRKLKIHSICFCFMSPQAAIYLPKPINNHY